MEALPVHSIQRFVSKGEAFALSLRAQNGSRGANALPLLDPFALGHGGFPGSWWSTINSMPIGAECTQGKTQGPSRFSRMAFSTFASMALPPNPHPKPLSRRSNWLALPTRRSGGRGAGVRGSLGPAGSVKPSWESHRFSRSEPARSHLPADAAGGRSQSKSQACALCLAFFDTPLSGAQAAPAASGR